MRCIFLLLATAGLATFAQDSGFWTNRKDFTQQGYTEFAYAGSYLYAARPCEGIDIFQLDADNRLTHLNFFPLPGDTVEDIRIRGNRLFLQNALAEQMTYLQWYDLSDPVMPVFENQRRVRETYLVWFVSEDGGTLYEHGFIGFPLYGITRIALDHPHLEETPFAIIDDNRTGYDKIVVEGDQVYLLGFRRVSAATLKVGTGAVVTDTKEIVLNGFDFKLMDNGEVLLVQTEDLLYVYDVSTPGRLIHRTTAPSEIDAEREAQLVLDRQLLLAISETQIRQFSLANPGNPQLVEAEFAHCQPCLIDPAEQRLLAPGYDGLTIQDYSAGIATTTTSLREAHGTFTDVAWRDDLVVGFSDGELWFLDWSDPDAPRVTQRLTVGGLRADLSFSDNYLYTQILDREARDNQRLRVFNVANINRIFQVDFFDFDDSHQDGARLVGIKDRKISIYSLNPWNLHTPLAEWSPISDRDTYSDQDRVFLKDNFILTTVGHRWNIFQFTPSGIQFLSSHFMGARAFLWMGDVLYIADSRLIVLDMSNPADPQVITTAPLGHPPWGPARLSTPFNNSLFVSGLYGTTHFDISDIRNPKQTTLSVTGLNGDPAIQGNEGLFITECPSGLARVSFFDCDPPIFNDPPTRVVVCEGENTVIDSGLIGEYQNIIWMRDGEVIPGETGTTLAVQGQAGPPVRYSCAVSGTCDFATLIDIDVISGTCDLSSAYARWQTDGYFCDRLNPTVLDFAASINSGDTCP
ncbi:hypothetical protein [Acanthopleuribacter pedis]|uniref:Ig-like domain-containing protein n=1 Tax=Acanthopleuribacter pedis TaxID=442870 RepID=A0A8J7U4C9_9BACT|nr:hypothetical protein [Acanthopleuribacter pedis]MBO1318156.1 hypothetical protein [Acanthopleuribacter pedis]